VYSIPNSVKSIRQVIDFLRYRWISEFDFDSGLWLQSTNKLVEFESVALPTQAGLRSIRKQIDIA
jgi:hypothetical protein